MENHFLDYRHTLDLARIQHHLFHVFQELSSYRSYIYAQTPMRSTLLSTFDSIDSLSSFYASPDTFYRVSPTQTLPPFSSFLADRLKNSPLLICHTLLKSLQSGKFHRPKTMPPQPPHPSSHAFHYDLWFNIEVYHCHGKKPQLSQIIHALGSNTLLDLRDKLVCVSDSIDEQESKEKENIDKINPKSSYFYIEQCFYNDTREDCVDFSTCLLQPGLSKSSMNRPLNTLSTLRCDFPYLFSHFGDCEHLLYFKDIRRFRKPLPLPLQLSTPLPFPAVSWQWKPRRRKCLCCEQAPAKYVTLYDRLAPENPCYYCEACYYYFHYDANGTLIYSDFEVYKYLYDL